ncbi:MAG: hypothetical protein JSR59_21485 [Proteobacteria bacterium]|nr:hypothetical protein [Pseudomonadota bacterium]
MSKVNDYAARIGQGVGDVARDAVADIGDSYQEVLLSHSPVTPPDGIKPTLDDWEPTAPSDTQTPPQPAAEPPSPQADWDLDVY